MRAIDAKRAGRLVTLIAMSIVLLAAMGCTTVKPWERDLLARRDMQFEPDTLEAARDAHVYFSKEASSGGGSGGGGGCGCN